MVIQELSVMEEIYSCLRQRVIKKYLQRLCRNAVRKIFVSVPIIMGLIH